MKVSEVFKSRKRPISFEIFPPKGSLTTEDAKEVVDELAQLSPDFISVTYSAGGGGNSGATTTIASMIQRDHAIPSVAHLTCQGLTHTTLAEKVVELRAAGIENVLALRGDPRPDLPEGDFTYASDLIAPLVDAGFCVGAAAYPEGHLDCLDLGEDIDHLKAKQDAGASFLVTQLCFDEGHFLDFRERAIKAGITIPITYGVMPFLSKKQVSRMIFMCGASLPSPIIKLLARYEDDPAALRAAGIDYACDQLVDLARHGVDGLHVYTMNHPDIARACVRAIRA